MPKIKTHRGAAKRIDVTKSGKLKRARCCKRHILTKKSTKRKRNLRRGAFVAASDASFARKLIPYK